ncbi:MAG: MBL fold metallo-hydrolase [Gemmatimonadales bacterium]|nr:MAG: MBL fold metallo-hydrolase [Gemmatimonadales bacterium]
MPTLDPNGRPEQVAPGCVRIPLPDPFVPGVTSVFVFGPTESPWLMDVGADTPESEFALRGMLTTMALSPESLRVLLSHSHLDHAGGLLRFTPHEVTAHRRAIDEMRESQPRSSRGPDALRRMGLGSRAIRVLAPNGEPVHGTPFASTAVQHSVDGDAGELPESGGWRWLLAEGHAPGHLMLFDPATRTLLAADQFLRMWKTPLLVSDPEFDSLGAYLDSIRTARELDPVRICSSHMKTMEDPIQWLEDTEASMKKRLDRVARAMEAGATTAEEVLATIYPAARQGPLRIVFLRELLAMLRHLVVLGLAKSSFEDGVERFYPV